MITTRKKKMRPILHYHGGKWRIGSWIASHFPKHRIYTEAFGGGAGVLLKKEKSYSEIYNDLDEEIVNLFRVMRDHGPALKKFLSLTTFSRMEYFNAYRPGKTSLIRAAHTIMKSFMGHGSDSIFRQSGFRANANRSGTTPAHDWVNYTKVMHMLTERLQNVIIENRDAFLILERFDGPTTLHYVDPPYIHKLRASSKVYRYEINEEEHIKLANFLKTLKGKIVVSGYPSELYDKLYEGWCTDEKETTTDRAYKVKEKIWMNFNPEIK